jgi:hypothetical protein
MVSTPLPYIGGVGARRFPRVADRRDRSRTVACSICHTDPDDWNFDGERTEASRAHGSL